MAIPPDGFWQRFARLWRHSLQTPDIAAALIARGARDERLWPATSPQAAVDRDGALAEELFDCEYTQPIVRIWRNHRALVVPRAFRNRPHFGDASAQCECPVVLRQSGGTAVMHGPHILNITRISTMARQAPFSIGSAFEGLGQVLREALADCGIEAGLGDVAGSHCPGRYSLQVAGRKLAGTAGFVRERGDMRVVVAHASLSLRTDPDDLACIQRFERILGMPANYDREAHTSVQEALLTSVR